VSPSADSRPRISVTGLGESGPVAADPRSIPEMVLESVEAALADARIGHDDVDAIVTASVDLFDGLTASNIAVTEVVGAVMKPETRIAADGLCALSHAACQLWAGAYETVLVVAHGKASIAPHHPLTQWAMDPIHLQPLGVDFQVCAGLSAQLLWARDPDARSRWAKITARRRTDASADDVVSPCTPQEVLASPVVASPLTEHMCAPLVDGACAVVLTTRPAGTPGEPDLALTGVGYDLSPHSPGARDLATWDGLGRALARACEQAGVGSPEDFDLLEPSCHYAHEEELFARAVPSRPGAEVSPGGGLFGGAVPVAAGLSRFVAAVRRMRETTTIGRALAHGAWGPAGQGQAVAILEATP